MQTQQQPALLPARLLRDTPPPVLTAALPTAMRAQLQKEGAEPTPPRHLQAQLPWPLPQDQEVEQRSLIHRDKLRQGPNEARKYAPNESTGTPRKGFPTKPVTKTLKGCH